MRITKFEHSCILAEEEGKTALIDPGIFSRPEVEKLDYLLITHAHPDHMDMERVKELVAKFPEAKVLGNKSVAAILGKEGIKTADADENVAMKNVKHENMMGSSPENTMFTVFGKLTHPGDSHSFNETAEVLALPVQAPWGSNLPCREAKAKSYHPYPRLAMERRSEEDDVQPA